MAKAKGPKVHKVRTSMNLPEALLKQGHHLAIEQGRPFGDLIAELLARYLKESPHVQK